MNHLLKYNKMNSKVFVFVGSSGTGKSTLLNYLRDNFQINCKELSARPFLPKNKGSYDKVMTDDIQIQIAYNNTITIFETLLDSKSAIYSRSPIDILAYMETLNTCKYLKNQQTELIQYLKDKLIWIYLPIEFPLIDKDDTLRGQNEEIRQLTDKYIQLALKDLNIEYFELRGSVKEREFQIDLIMNQNDIIKNENKEV